MTLLMRTTLPTRAALLAVTLSLAACGSQPQPSATDGNANAAPSGVLAANVPGAAPQASPFLMAQSVIGDCTVTPKRTLLTLNRGASASVTKNVCVPQLPPRLDFDLIVDNSGSYGDDIGNLKSSGGGLAAAIVNGIRNAPGNVADSVFGLSTFVDFPIPPFGSASTGDYAYARNQDLTFNVADFVTAVNNMVLRYGADEPESQYEALYQAATGAGRDLNGNGSYADTGDVAPGLGVSFRSGAAHVIALTTDASFHVGAPYPGASKAATIAALKAKGIQVIGLKAPGASTELDQIVAETGGAIKTTTSSSSDIVSAVLAALNDLTYKLTVTPSAGCPLTVSYLPASPLLSAGTTTAIQELVTAPSVAGTYVCTMTFTAGGLTLGTEEITVRVR